MRKQWFASVVVALAALAFPASSLGAELFVDDQGDDQAGANNCLTQTTPCQTINHAITINNGIFPGTIHVGGGDYNEHFPLGNGISLVGDHFSSGGGIDTSGATVVHNSTTFNVLTIVAGTSPRIVSGITFEGGPAADALVFGDPIGTSNLAITGNTFQNSPSNQLLWLNGGTNVLVSQNHFVSDPLTANTQTGIFFTPAAASDQLTVSGNTLSDQNRAIDASGNNADASIEISDNTITGVHDTGSNGFGVNINKLRPTITGNTITPRSTGVANSTGIGINDTSPPASVQPDTATLSRNQVFGFGAIGEYVGDIQTLDLSDELVANNGLGVELVDIPAATMTHATVTQSTGSASEVLLIGGIAPSDMNLSLDSTFLGGQGVHFDSGPGLPTCTSAFSDTTDTAPFDPPTGTPAHVRCGQTLISDPMFVSASDFHLQAGSPLIDAANPASGDGLDVFGSARTLGTAAPCVSDIGAAEFVPAAVDCTPAAAASTSTATTPPTTATPTTATPKKKCKKKKKKKHASAAKKKCKKKKK